LGCDGVGWRRTRVDDGRPNHKEGARKGGAEQNEPEDLGHCKEPFGELAVDLYRRIFADPQLPNAIRSATADWENIEFRMKALPAQVALRTATGCKEEYGTTRCCIGHSKCRRPATNRSWGGLSGTFEAGKARLHLGQRDLGRHRCIFRGCVKSGIRSVTGSR
jgi:hypothetical protein